MKSVSEMRAPRELFELSRKNPLKITKANSAVELKTECETSQRRRKAFKVTMVVRKQLWTPPK